MWQCETVGKQYQAKHTRYKELHISVLEFTGTFGKCESETRIAYCGTVDKPHCGNEANRTKHTYRREILHRIQAIALQNGERSRVRQSQGRHIEGHAYGVDGDEQCLVGHFRTHTEIEQPNHCHTGNSVAYTKQTLGLNKTVGNNSHYCGHEYRHNSLDGIKPCYLSAHACLPQIVAHTSEVCTPYGKLQEVHHYEP